MLYERCTMCAALDKPTVMMPFRLSTLLTALRAHLTEKVAAVSSPDRTGGEECTKCRALYCPKPLHCNDRRVARTVTLTTLLYLRPTGRGRIASPVDGYACPIGTCIGRVASPVEDPTSKITACSPAGSNLHWHWITPCEMLSLSGPGN